ncbi:ImmA/IrrE family metallo-endopeptidase [Cryobacterium fucosi]|uniref:ImmA/IrrE family metallo-endopeptidase n=1 Tax=Cryobacterium fucosi TaxID=1259157 RepID=A0A4V3IVR7_9MICO|nr:ImmA/IrrE family metallo-endopeptidase [Cryobacterium fucosi]TFD79411.1 ImmA/IrrE family metallo-endopeptidase [Cryobacterium fucosi]
MNTSGWVKRAVYRVSPALRASFAADPLGSLTQDFGLQVQPAPHLGERREGMGSCDGVSFLADGVILYSPTVSRRQNFTLAHELAHHLLELDDKFQDMLAEQDNPHPLLETVCDAVAQELLVPSSLIEAVVSKDVIRATHLVELFDRSNASLHASAIALARRLPGLGAVVVFDREESVVRHASVQPDPIEGWPKVYPWRGQSALAHPLFSVAPGAEAVKRIRWRMPWGDDAEFYANASGQANTVVAIFSDRDLWSSEASHLSILRAYDARPHLHLVCCGQDKWIQGYPCSTCRQPFCPICGQCKCNRQSTGLCTECGLLKGAALVVDGVCVDCR